MAIAVMTVAAMEVAEIKIKFYDRDQELTRIKKEFTKLKNHSSVLVLAGRRRIGKTRLVFEAHKENPSSIFSLVKKYARIWKGH